MSAIVSWIEENLEDILWGLSAAFIVVVILFFMLWHTKGKGRNKWDSTGW